MISAALGLHPNVNPVPVATITGATVSLVHVTVRDTATAGLLHPSNTFHVLVCDFKHPPVTAESTKLGVPTLQLSVAVALPNAPLISAALGLHPNDNVVPVATITGATVSLVQVNVRVQVFVSPHAVAEKVNICCLLHVPVIAPASQVTVTGPHELLAVIAPPNGAVPLAIVAHVGNVGLQPNAIVCPQLAN